MTSILTRWHAALLLVLVQVAAPRAAAGWWNNAWRHRVRVTVDSGLYDRRDCLIAVPLDLAQWGSRAGITATVDPASLRVIEVTGGSCRETPSEYRAVEGPNAPAVLVWRVSGDTESMSERCYDVYFGVTNPVADSGRDPPFADLDTVLARDLVPNGGFEAVDKDGDALNWSPIRSAAHTVGRGATSREQARSGIRSLVITKPRDDGQSQMYSCHGWRSPVPAEPDARYRFSAWTRAAGNSQHCVGFYFLADGWQSTEKRVYKILCGHGTHDWQELSVVLTAPADARYIHIRLYIYKGSGTVFFDDIEVERLPLRPAPKVRIGVVEPRG